MSDPTQPDSREGEADVAVSSDRPAEYVVVARRYRPQRLDQLVGQEQVALALSNAIDTHRVGHAYLFTGARGVGKTSTARIFSKALNCADGPAPTPCDVCDICRSIATGEDVDVLEIDGASNRGIDEIRQLRSNVNVRPSRARFKIYIIDEVHMLTKEAFNALLKTLEEPPEHVKFIFCTTDPERIPITVLSRCQRFDFAPIETSEIVTRLKQIVSAEGAEADEEALQMLARRASGSMRDSQSLLEQLLSFSAGGITADGVHAMLGTARSGRLTALVQHLSDRDGAAALAEVDAALAEGVDAGQLAEQLLDQLRDLMVIAVGGGPELLLHHSESDAQTLAGTDTPWELNTLLAALQILDQTVARMRQSMHGRVLLEMAIVRIAALDELEDLSQLVASLRSGQLEEAAAPPRAADQSTDGKKKVDRRVDPAAATAVPEPPKAVRESPNAAPEPPKGGASPAVRPERSSATALAASPPATPKSLAADDPIGDPMPQGAPVAGGTAAPLAPASSADSEASTTVIALTQENVQKVWQATIKQLQGLTAGFAEKVNSVELTAPSRLALAFPPSYNSAKAFLGRPEKLAEVQQALTRITGQTVNLDLRTQAPKAPAAPRAAVVPRRELIRQANQHPMVRSACELFGADVTRVDPPTISDTR